MNRLMLFAAGAGLALVPAVVGLTGNSSFAEGVAVRVPAQVTLGSDDVTPEPTTTPTGPVNGTASVSPEPGDDIGGATAHAEPGDDIGGATAHAEPGDDRGGASSGSTEMAHRSNGHTPESTSASAPSTSTNDRGGPQGGHSVSGGSGRHGGSDDGPGHQ
jgi:hypothetical protein